MYMNEAEITATKNKDENLAILRFYYREPKLKEGSENTLKRPYPILIPGPAICMTRKRMKDVLKKFLTWMAEADEGRIIA